jgi:acetyl-CoA carboxylase biotin carboxylase subunit
MFRKVMIANRGEIAVRLIRACREMDIPNVAIYSEADRSALHVRYATEAYCVGPAPSAQSYLNMERIIETAKKAGVDGIHPGYGFLSENAVFAQMVEDAGISFIGPPPGAIRLMGSKTAAREAMMKAKVPVVPGCKVGGDDDLRQAAEKIGFPVMVKAAAGGGGKGMRIVRGPKEMASALRAARSEAKSSFKDDAVYLEKYLVRPRHIEIQVLADKHGNCIHLFERECSIQRRHQKVIEEAPSMAVDEAMRAKMGATAVAAAKAAGYWSAGTCEFLVDRDRNFYFLEMNTRLQVEHPVTEYITGFDIVKEMFRIASGEKLSIRQEDVSINGWSIECRIYAEDPFNDFLPSPGRIVVMRVPAGPGVRDDRGVYTGYEVPIHYDPLISKLSTWGRSRGEAIERMRRALAEYVIKGIKTNIPFHQKVMRHPAFVSGDLHTGFIDDHKILESGEPEVQEANRLVAIVAAALLQEQRAREFTVRRPTEGEVFANAWKMAGRRAKWVI